MPASGSSISMGQMRTEFGRSGAFQLTKASDGTYGTLNHSGSHNGSAPHSMSEFYSYFHMPNLVQPAGIVELWDARAGADSASSDWESIYGGDTTMSLNGGTAYNDDAPNNFAFDGTNDNAVTDSTITLGGRWTIAMWMRHTADQSHDYDRLWGMSDYDFDAAEDTTGKLRILDSAWSIVDGVDLDDGDWQHIVFTYDSGASAGESLKVYEEGVLADTSGDGRTVTSQLIYLGSQQAGWYWAGEIGQYILWGQALTSSEVTSLFSNDKGYFAE